jgi:hypothetical protein
MKLFDEKGRVFGIINIIDMLVIIAIFLVLALGVYKLGGKSVSGLIQNKSEITFEVKAIGKQPFQADGLKIGQNLISAGAIQEDASIISITKTPTDSQNPNSSGKAILSKSPILVDIAVVLKAKVNLRDPIMKVGIQELAIPNQFTVKTQTGALLGIVSRIDLPEKK